MKINPLKSFDYIYNFTAKVEHSIPSSYKHDHYGPVGVYKRGSLLCQELACGGHSVAFNGKIAVTDPHGNIAYLGGMTPERLCNAAEQIREKIACHQKQNR